MCSVYNADSRMNGLHCGASSLSPTAAAADAAAAVVASATVINLTEAM